MVHTAFESTLFELKIVPDADALDSGLFFCGSGPHARSLAFVNVRPCFGGSNNNDNKCFHLLYSANCDEGLLGIRFCSRLCGRVSTTGTVVTIYIPCPGRDHVFKPCD